MNYKLILAGIIPIVFVILLLSPFQKNMIYISNQLFFKILTLLIVLFYAEISITYGFLSLVFVVFFYSIFDNKYTGNEPDSIIVSKRRYMTPASLYKKVPFIIYQTWHTKDLPPKMKECVENLKKQNPEFEHHLYDDEDCRQFIKDNFDASVLHAYDSLIPGAYKADLWRYCVLYKNGGIYIDIKFQCEPGFKLSEMANDNNFVLDRPFANMNIPLETEIKMIQRPDYYENVYTAIDTHFWKNKQIGIYNAVMSACPNNPILLECIHEIVENVQNKYYGYNELYPTGPGLFGEKYFGDKIVSKISNFQYFNSINGTFIISKKGKKVLSHYPEYREEQFTYGKKNRKYYLSLWKDKDIYFTQANDSKTSKDSK
jgi:mannosyltransferase OCH1-like enzyme